jgi:hypothetical protein
MKVILELVKENTGNSKKLKQDKVFHSVAKNS